MVFFYWTEITSRTNPDDKVKSIVVRIILRKSIKEIKTFYQNQPWTKPSETADRRIITWVWIMSWVEYVGDSQDRSC